MSDNLRHLGRWFWLHFNGLLALGLIIAMILTNAWQLAVVTAIMVSFIWIIARAQTNWLQGVQAKCEHKRTYTRCYDCEILIRDEGFND